MDKQARAKLLAARTASILSPNAVLAFWGLLTLRLELIEDNTIPTMCTDGKTLRYNAEFVNKTSDATLKVVLYHEAGHCLLKHPFRMRGLIPPVALIAMEFPVNEILFKMGLKPDDDNWLLDPQFNGMLFEQIYRLLLKDVPTLAIGAFGNLEKAFGQALANKIIGRYGHGDVSPFNGSQEEKSQLEIAWDLTIVNAAKAIQSKFGDLPGGLGHLFNCLKVRVPWEHILIDYLTTKIIEYSWARPNPLYIKWGYYLPSASVKKLGHVVVGIDTSGSISEDRLNESISSVLDLIDSMAPSKISILPFDTRVVNPQVYEAGDKVSIKVSGRGGTNFRPIFDWVDKNVDDVVVCIILTDLAGKYPQSIPEYPVLWLTHKQDTTPVPFGHIINVDR